MQKMGVWVFRGHPHQCLSYFKKYANDFGKVVKLTSFFHSSNFLITSYAVESSGIHTILENEHGDTMQFSGMNCGYDGSSPSATAEVLIELGVKPETAHSWTHDTSLVVTFDDSSGERIASKEESFAFFEEGNCANSYAPVSPCPLNDTTFIRVFERTVYMVSPTKYNPVGFYNCLNIMKPVRVEYSLDNSPVQDNAFDAGEIERYYFGHRRNLEKVSQHLPMNFMIFGREFSLFCFVEEDVLVHLVKDTYFFLHHEAMLLKADSPLCVPATDKQSFWHFIKQAILSFNKRKKRPLRGSFLVQSREEANRSGEVK